MPILIISNTLLEDANVMVVIVDNANVISSIRRSMIIMEPFIRTLLITVE